MQMKPILRHYLKQLKGVGMESIDVRDLPEEEARLVAAFVEFLRHKLREVPERKAAAEVGEQEWSAAALTSFAKDWDNEQDAIYDNWREHYHVPEG